MTNKLRFLTRNKQSFIAFFVIFTMLFNACSSPFGSDDSDSAADFTPVFFYVDSNGNFIETDLGRTVVLVDEEVKVLFYSDNIASSDQRVGIAFEDKTIIFFFARNQNFPNRIVLSDSEESFNGVFTSYNSVTQTYGLTFEQGGDREIWSNIALSKDIFAQYKDDPEFTTSQNLRMRNLYTALHIYMSLHDFIAPDDTLQARFVRNIFNRVKNIVTNPYVQVAVVGAILVVGLAATGIGFATANPALFGAGVGLAYAMVTPLANILSQCSSPGNSSPGSSSPGNSSPGSSSPGSGGTPGGDDTPGGGGGTTSPPPPVAVTGVSLNKTSVSLVVGAAENLIPTITPANATNKAVTWSSSNVAVATVSSNGTVTGVGVGSATITVTTSDGGRTASSTVTVNPVLVTGVTMNKATTSMLVDGTETLIATIAPLNATNQNVTWSSSNTGVATVSNTGEVTGLSPGIASITVTTIDGSNTATCVVVVSAVEVNVTGISLDKTSASIGVSSTVTLIATITPSNATNQNVTWSSSDTAVATVSTTGVVTGVSNGTATITAKSVDGDIPATSTVTVGLANQLAWIHANAQSDGVYIVEVGADENIVRHNLSYFGMSNITVILRGIGQNRTISLSPAQSSNEMFAIFSGVTLILDNNITLQGRGVSSPFDLLAILNGGTLKMNPGSTITQGDVYVGGTFDMDGGNITGGSPDGVSVRGIFNMNGGNISGSRTGVYVNNGTFDMSGGNISGNSSSGVWVADSGTFNMNDGTISGNTSSSSGGGVRVSGDGTFSMSGGTISGNTASSSGGGVSVAVGGPIFTMNGGTISGNTASSGGGVSVSGGGTFNMSDGTISSNTTNRSSSEGGGVGIINQGIFNKTGGTITGYTSDTDNGNVVRSDTGMVINNRGHAVYGFTNQGVVEKRKEVTAGPGVNLSFDGHTGTWSGNWDF